MQIQQLVARVALAGAIAMAGTGSFAQTYTKDQLQQLYMQQVPAALRRPTPRTSCSSCTCST